MLKYIAEDINAFIIDIPELNELRKHQMDINTKKTTPILVSQYYKSSIAFFDWYIDYCETILNSRNYSDKQICEHIFRPKHKSINQWKEYLVMSIYISKQYVEYLKTKLSETNAHKFNHAITGLEIDLEWLIARIEIDYKKNAEQISLSSARRKELSPTDIYFAARSMFHIEEYNGIEDIYLRDLKPVVMFQIRQLLEVFGKNLIGYNSISDKDGNEVKKFTQIAWDFIKSEIKAPNPRIKLPFDVHMILAINNWANSFVHTTFLYCDYIQFYVLNAIQVLFSSERKGIRIFTGSTIRKGDCADVLIMDYNSLKRDFEETLESRLPGLSVTWMEPEQVGAYIITL